jgi:hypothetical protein
VLKSNDQAKSNPEQTVKYNLLNTRKTLKVETAVGGNTTGDGACNTRAAIGQTLAVAYTKKPLDTTRHGIRYET